MGQTVPGNSRDMDMNHVTRPPFLGGGVYGVAMTSLSVINLRVELLIKKRFILSSHQDRRRFKTHAKNFKANTNRPTPGRTRDRPEQTAKRETGRSAPPYLGKLLFIFQFKRLQRGPARGMLQNRLPMRLRKRQHQML